MPVAFAGAEEMEMEMPRADADADAGADAAAAAPRRKARAAAWDAIVSAMCPSGELVPRFYSNLRVWGLRGWAEIGKACGTRGWGEGGERSR